ncbi:MAG TPA: hypothetical protein PK886_01205 [Candidatus Paceibacterota bacterium]|nr:hypothetical protein [Candidatus Paceibacterota bacterium]
MEEKKYPYIECDEETRIAYVHFSMSEKSTACINLADIRRAVNLQYPLTMGRKVVNSKLRKDALNVLIPQAFKFQIMDQGKIEIVNQNENEDVSD